jgi:hypothetical protein
MSYSVQHVRFTLECDACGNLEKRDLDADSEEGTRGWGEITMRTPTGRSAFCCPSCAEMVEAILTKKARAELDAKAKREAECVHDYQSRGLLSQCTKCQRWR